MPRTTKLLSSMHRGATEPLSYRIAEVHIRSAEAALHLESQQRDIAISMAREVAAGQSAVLLQVAHQAECREVEQVAQASRMTTMYADADRQFLRSNA